MFQFSCVGVISKLCGKKTTATFQSATTEVRRDIEIQPKSEKTSIEMSSAVRDLATGRTASGSASPNQRVFAVVRKQSSEDSIPCRYLKDIKPTQVQSSVVYVNENILRNLPNDLTKLVYLASIRDYNTGTYLHPEFSHLYDLKFADQVLRLCHEKVFGRMLGTSIREYVTQMTMYIQFTGADEREVIATWKSLQAYRATVPVTADKLAVEVFSLNVDTALSVLEEALQRSSTEDSGSRSEL